ncbi:sulfite exporter TauE/SafE family protein [Glaciecola siphonariae]|uniref:Probable membrane transporter protein n=1 Tax=Glaciecola siphonariae TaxID=521012 RepID=A0ABV9M272_9ALTE
MLTRIGRFFNEHKFKLLLLACWIVLLSVQPNLYDLLDEYVSFVFLGVLGAIFANSTGAGGGVVFVPFFNQLALSSQTIVATSFAIQCCGMTAGALTWYRHYRASHKLDPQWSMMPKGLSYTVPFSIAGILFAQFAFGHYTDAVQNSLHLYFGLFSIALAVCIYGSIPLMKRNTFLTALLPIDIVALCMIALGGGVITAWLSVGVGELVAVYLILRGFNITFAIALAVILSAMSVWAAIVYHLFISQAIYWQIVLFAGAGAVIGGMIAKHVVLFFSPKRLKIFFATWVMVMGLAGLPIFP